MMMRPKQEKGDIRSALPRITRYLRSSMGIIALALLLAALSAVMTIIGHKHHDQTAEELGGM